jgi:hypothetical protein
MCVYIYIYMYVYTQHIYLLICIFYFSKVHIYCFLIMSFLETGSHYVAQNGLELTIFLFQPPKCWEYRCV